jgi:integrase
LPAAAGGRRSTACSAREARRLGIAKTPHGLRKSCAVRLAEIGCSEEEIDTHTTERMSKHYRKGARQKLLARAAVDRLENAERTAAAKPTRRKSAKSPQGPVKCLR